MTQVTVNSNTYSDDGTSGRDMLNGGHATYFFPLVQDCLTDFAASEVAVAAYADALAATSTSSLLIGTGSKTFTTQSGKQYATGQFVKATDNVDTSRWMLGSVTGYSGTTLELNITDTNGSGTYGNWTLTISGPKGATGATGPAVSAERLQVSTGTTLGVSDKAKIVEASGTFTLAFSAAATLGSGWWIRVRNVGTGVITLNPDGAETIDSLASFLSYPGESRFIYCDGSALFSFVEVPFNYLFSASGSVTIPPGYSRMAAFLRGAGAGGGCGAYNLDAALTYGGRGGGGGSYGAIEFPVTTSEVYTVTVGAGGTGAAGLSAEGASAAGTDGGSSALSISGDTFYTAGGGSATTTAAAYTYNLVGGLDLAGVTQLQVGATHFTGATYHVNTSTSDAVGSVYGGAAGGRGGTAGSGVGNPGKAGGQIGTTAAGGGGAAGVAAGNGGTADYSGGGGGGGSTGGTAAGNGADGAPGCGGGGGGAVGGATGAATSGAGGDGGAGFVRARGVL